MKLKKDYITQEIEDKQIMVAIGESANNFHGLVKSNETAAFIVNCLKEETTIDEIVKALLDEYEVEEEKARNDVIKIVDKLRSIKAIEE